MPPFGLRNFCAVVAIAGFLMTFRIGSRDLWQDEGETAVLARSVLDCGIPRAKIGENLVLQDETGYDAEYRWTFHPWGQFYLAAAGIGLLGSNETAARLPFAICGILSVALLYVFVWRIWRDPLAASLAALSLATAPAFVLHSRQCRYYALSALACLCIVTALVDLLSRPRPLAGVLLGLALTLQFYADFGTLIGAAPGLVVLALLLRPTRRSLGAILLSAALAAILIAPGLWLHRERFARMSPSQAEWPIKLAAHLAYLDGWFVPLGLLVLGGLVIFIQRLRSGQALTRPARVALGCAVIVLSSAILLSFPASYPHIRYVMATMPLCKLILGVALAFGYTSMRRRAYSFAACAIPTGIGFAILNWTNVGALPGQLLATRPYQQTPDYCSSGPWYLRCDGAGLAAELLSDFVSSDRAIRRIAADLARPGDVVLLNYGDLALMFDRPDLILRGGASNDARPITDARTPDLILLPLANGIAFRGYLDELIAGGGYRTTKLVIPDVPYGNIPEPRDHRFVTPYQTQDLWVMLRADHQDRLKGLPVEIAELTRRWTRAE